MAGQWRGLGRNAAPPRQCALRRSDEGRREHELLDDFGESLVLAGLHFGAQAFGAGMVGTLEGLKGLLPQLASGLMVAGRLVGVAEVDQYLGAVPDCAK